MCFQDECGKLIFSYVYAHRAIKEALPISRHSLGCQCLKLPEIGRTQRPRRRVQIVIGLKWYRAGTPLCTQLRTYSGRPHILGVTHPLPRSEYVYQYARLPRTRSSGVTAFQHNRNFEIGLV